MGKIVINIDWDKHFLLVNTDDGKMLELIYLNPLLIMWWDGEK